jgi:hypothetical protein
VATAPPKRTSRGSISQCPPSPWSSSEWRLAAERELAPQI